MGLLRSVYVYLLVYSCFSWVAGDTIVVYNGQTGELGLGFQNWSWGTVNLKDTKVVRPGDKYSFSLVVDNWKAIYIEGGFDSDPSNTLSFYIYGATGGEKLAVRVESGTQTVGQIVDISSKIQANNWAQVSVKFSDFGYPDGTALDAIWFQANSADNSGTVYLDQIQIDHTPAPPTPAAVKVDTKSQRHTFSNKIFGVNFASVEQLTRMKYPVNRWGGNAVTRYAWDIDANNHASDWFFEDIANDVANVSNLPFGSSSDVFIQNTLANGAQVLLTIPTIGWTPFDRQKRCGFSVKKYGAQQQVDQWDADCGNGIDSTGKNLKGNDPKDTSRQVGVDYQLSWIKHIDAVTGKGKVRDFQLDNEPGIWHSTHRDVHPDPLTYDELWNYTVKYASGIKASFPDAVIYGPIFWGWCPYLFSPADNCADGPDRQKHGDLPLLEWYIDQIGKYKAATGVQLVDVIDVHYYPQEQGVTGNGDDPATGSLRLRVTRALWDPSYVDESWIKQPIFLIPRIKQWIAAHSPGLKVAFSEWMWGDDNSVTSALGHAEALAIFAREGLDIASRWVVPASQSLIEDAWSIFLNYDGKGANILGSSSVSATSSVPAEVTSYAFDNGKQLFVLVINKKYDTEVPVTIDVSSAASSGTATFYQFARGQRLKQAGTGSVSGGTVKLTVPLWSATLVVVSYGN